MGWIKFIGTVVTLHLIAHSSFASFGKDSVGVFHSPDKVIILVTEKGLTSRLAQFMNLWSEELNFTGRSEALIWQTPQSDFTMRCFQNYDEHSCTFKLLPTSTFVDIQERAAFIELPLAQPTRQDFEFEFMSSRNDYFVISSQNQILSIKAIKKYSPH